MTKTNIGVLSDSALQRKRLAEVLARYGLQVVVSCEPPSLSNQTEDKLASIDCWIVDLSDDVSPDPILKVVEQYDQALLFGLGQAPLSADGRHDEQYISWERRLISKLEGYLGRIAQLDNEDTLKALVQVSSEPEAVVLPTADAPHEFAREIWILAASLGGPAAVKAFLDELPAGINAGFLYAQHIDRNFARVLSQVLARHSALQMQEAAAGARVRNGEVLLVPVDHQIRFSDVGILFSTEDWPGPYGPSIDQLLANALQHYGSRCHVIVFSGMGNDGAMTIPKMKQAGCTVWTQTPETCASASMPQSVLDLGCSDFSATPVQLARALIDRVGCHHAYDVNANIPTSPVAQGGVIGQANRL